MNQQHYEYYKDFLYSQEADKLLEFLQKQIPWTQVKYFKPQRGYIITPRLTWVAGFHTKNQYVVNDIQPNPIPAFLLPLKSLIESHLNTTFNYMLFSKYRDSNDSITYHSDNENFLGVDPVIASLTLGCSRPFVLKNKTTKVNEIFNLAHGDLFVMKGDCQKNYFHAVPKQKKPVGERFSITFRNVLNENGSKNYYTYNLGKNKKPFFLKER